MGASEEAWRRLFFVLYLESKYLTVHVQLWKVRLTFKFNPAENYKEKMKKLMYKKTENK